MAFEFFRFQIDMAKTKKILTSKQKRQRKIDKAERQKKYQWIFLNGKQVRVKNEPEVDGLSIDDFITENADQLFLHQNMLWESIENEDRACLEDIDSEESIIDV